MQTNNAMRVVLSTALAILVLTGLTNLWALYLFALLKGIADAFYYPAQAALLPRIVTREQPTPIQCGGADDCGVERLRRAAAGGAR